MKSGIYCIENLVNGKRYIGQGLDAKKRMHFYHRNSHALRRAIDKYGEENFKRYILVYCEEWELHRLEIEAIKVYHSHVSDNGYNISFGGSAPMRGRKHSDESIAKIKENSSNTGKPLSEETRKKISDAQTGEKNHNFGKTASDETKRKLSEMGKGERNSFFGKLHTDESRKKISKTKKRKTFDKKPDISLFEYLGVSPSRQKWTASININKKKVYIGSYQTENEAALARDNYIIENNLPNPLNFPQ